MKQFISKNAMVIAAMAIAAGSYGLMSFGTMDDPPNPVTVYFHGQPDVASEVAEESNWKSAPNGENCNTGNELACSMQVDQSDLSGNELDPSKITLGTASTTSGFVPTRIGGSSATTIKPYNRN